jgi:aminoglycoside phosphotransferase (APT) family kinase protein
MRSGNLVDPLWRGKSGAFRTALGLDDATWTRGRGWTLWKALITLADHKDMKTPEAREAGRIIDEVLADQAHGE